MPKTDDIAFMECALAEARKGEGLTNPNPAVGAVVVRDGRIVGRGFHPRVGEPHAEVFALRDAGAAARGADLYVTLEPCSTSGRTPPCTDAVIAAGIRRVVAANSDCFPAHRGRGFEILRRAGIECETGVLARECAELNKSFFHWASTGEPYVLLKMAMTLDGRIACADGTSKWITGEAARARVQYLRSLADGIMVSGQTLRIDRPRLNVRERPGFDRTVRRFIATRSMSRGEVEGYFHDDPAPEPLFLDPEGAWLKRLGAEKVTNLLVEGGGELAGEMLRRGWVNEVEFHIAPKILGGRGSIPVVGGGDPASLAEALPLTGIRVEQLPDGDVIYHGRCR